MNIENVLNEFSFKAVRSSGPGGQHVNKTSSKIEISFNIDLSEGLSLSEKELLNQKLASRISTEGVITLHCSETRSQHRNKALAIERMVALIKSNLHVSKVRKKTKPSRNAIERRLKEKKTKALKKERRKPPMPD